MMINLWIIMIPLIFYFQIEFSAVFGNVKFYFINRTIFNVLISIYVYDYMYATKFEIHKQDFQWCEVKYRETKVAGIFLPPNVKNEAHSKINEVPP